MNALVLDDDLQWREIVADLVDEAGLRAHSVSSVAELSEIYSTDFQFAIVDLCLDENNHRNQDGLLAVEWLREKLPECVVWMLTGHATVELAVELLTQGKIDYIVRKEMLNREDLISRIRMLDLDATPKKPADQPAPSSLSILVVENDLAWASLLEEELSHLGKVRICSSASEALMALRSERFQAAVVDLFLRQDVSEESPASEVPKEGLDLLHLLNSQGIKIAVLSGFRDLQGINRLLRTEMVSLFIEKHNFSLEKLTGFLTAIARETHTTGLTDRELMVFELVKAGKTNKEIAEILLISTNTVKRHLKSIFVKAGVHTRTSLVTIPADQIK